MSEFVIYGGNTTKGANKANSFARNVSRSPVPLGGGGAGPIKSHSSPSKCVRSPRGLQSDNLIKNLIAEESSERELSVQRNRGKKR